MKGVTLDNSDDPSFSEYTPLDLSDSVELLEFFNPAVGKTVTLYQWQVELGEFLCTSKPTSQEPLKYCLCACNGSGKDAFIIAPFAVWFILTKVRSRVVITSSSGVQLTSQTENYIAELARKVNAAFKDRFGVDILKVRQRYIKCLATGSEINLFATDEEERAEGYHPLEPGAEMAVVINEAKSVDAGIFRAARRCTGYNYFLLVSTPGEPKGDFYTAWNLYDNKRKVTYYDCPHHSKSEFEYDRITLGEDSAWFRSKWLAEFTTIGGNYIIGQGDLRKLRQYIRNGSITTFEWDEYYRVGLDLAAGGDENVISVWRGNQQLYEFAFREADTTVSTDKIISFFLQKQLTNDNTRFFGDDGGVGRSIIDQLRRKGYRIARILNQSRAINVKDYRNRGMELWYKFKRLVELELIKPLPDADKLWEQLEKRRYKVAEDAAIRKLQLESKPEAKADGLPSPDRADAAILAFVDVSLDNLLNTRKKKDQKIVIGISMDNLLKKYEDKPYEGIEAVAPKKKGNKIYGSLNVAIRSNSRSTPWQTRIIRNN